MKITEVSQRGYCAYYLLKRWSIWKDVNCHWIYPLSCVNTCSGGWLRAISDLRQVLRRRSLTASGGRDRQWPWVIEAVLSAEAESQATGTLSKLGGAADGDPAASRALRVMVADGRADDFCRAAATMT